MQTGQVVSRIHRRTSSGQSTPARRHGPLDPARRRQRIDLRASHINALYDQLEATGGRSGGGLAAKTVQNIPDVDLDGYELHIDWTLGHVGHDMRWKPRPKSEAGKRTIALDPATVDALRQHRRAQLEQRLKAGPA